jgi:hypothetical protein
MYQKGRNNKINIQEQLQDIIMEMKEPNQHLQGDESRPPKNQLLRSKKALKAVRDTAWEHQRKFAVEKEAEYKTLNKVAEAKIIRRIWRAEQRRQSLRIQKAVTKPQSGTGGLTHILITDDATTTRVDNKHTMHTILHNQNINHFAQAKNTPCVEGILAQMLGHSGVTSTCNEIVNRQYDTTQLPTNIAEICNQLQRKRHTQSPHMPMSAMMDGFQKWRESTTTSPSGKHLGIYRTLTRAASNYYDLPSNAPKDRGDNNAQNKTTAELALQIQNHLINLAIKHTHSYRRWQNINNLFIEKLPGYPLIGKLRVIHIYEADWNLLLKYFISYQNKQEGDRGSVQLTQRH